MYQTCLAFAACGLVLTLAVAGLTLYGNKKKASAREGDDGNRRSFPAGFIVKLGELIERFYIPVLFIIFAVFLYTRIKKLDLLPNGFHVDELSMAVDAKSIRDHGTDRWGIRFPVYFQNYGAGQNSFYIYIQSLLLMFLPCTIFSFRIQAVLWGALCFFAMYGICRELFESKGWALLGPILVTVLPVYVMSERWGLEAYLFLPFSSFIMFFAIRAVKYGKWYDWILTGTVMGLALYTYAVSYVILPIFLALTGIYLAYLKKLSIKNLLQVGIPMGLLAFPLIVFQLVCFGFIPPFSTPFSDFVPLPLPRGNDMKLSNVLVNIPFWRKLFLGGEELTYNVFPEFGTVYMFLIPFFIAGLVIAVKELISSLREKKVSLLSLLLFLFIGNAIFLMIVDAPSVNRCNGIFAPVLVLIAVAVFRLFKTNPLCISWLTVWTGASFALFMYYYVYFQIPVYGIQPVHTSASAARAILKSEESYIKAENTLIYVLFEDPAMAPE